MQTKANAQVLVRPIGRDEDDSGSAYGASIDALRALHDAQRWGASRADDGQLSRVVRVASLIRHVGHLLDLDAVRVVSGKVVEAAWRVSSDCLYLVRGAIAERVTERHVWRQGYRPCPPSARFFDSVSLEEAVAYGVAVGCEDRLQRLVYKPRRLDGQLLDLKALPGLPQLAGPRGALEWAAAVWGGWVASFDDLDDGVPMADGSECLGRLAVLETDAVAIVRELAPAAPDMSTVRLLPQTGRGTAQWAVDVLWQRKARCEARAKAPWSADEDEAGLLLLRQDWTNKRVGELVGCTGDAIRKHFKEKVSSAGASALGDVVRSLTGS